MELDDNKSIFLYTDKNLWDTSNDWWFIEISQNILEISINKINELESDDDSVILFSLKGGLNSLEKGVTANISTDTIHQVEVHKSPTSLTLGMILSEGGYNAASLKMVPSTSKTDCYLVGEKFSVCTLNPTYPRLSTVYQLLHSSSDYLSFRKGLLFSDIVLQTQATESQIQQFLLESFSICIANTTVPQSELWHTIPLLILQSILENFFCQFRLQGLSCTQLKWDTLYHLFSITDIPDPSFSFLKTTLLTNNQAIFQLLLLFCDVDQSDFNLDHIIYTASNSKEAYTHYMTVLYQIHPTLLYPSNNSLSDITFSISLSKIVRLIMRTVLCQQKVVSLYELLYQMALWLQTTLPAILLESDPTPSTELHWRGHYCLDIQELSSPNSGYLGDFREYLFQGQDIPDSLNQQDIHRLLQRVDITDSRYLQGFAVITNELGLHTQPTVSYVCHPLLSWDWQKRLKTLFRLKKEWGLNELNTFLSPLRHFCTIPPIGGIATTAFIKAKQRDRYGNPLYINRRLLLD